ncbi:hypothetical protein HK101_011117 [Irineochytrium annulatum]|nr:hypothetical protein HK101_011117 [Irineochytrium annulatum]
MNAANWTINAPLYATFSTPLTSLFDATDAVVALLPPPGVKIEVLDVACGPGSGSVAMARALQQRNDGSCVLATDYSEGMLEEARKLIEREKLGNVELAVVDGMDMKGITNESKDVAMSQFGVICMPDGVKALAEMHRVLRPGGIVSITTWERPTNIFPSIAEAVTSLLDAKGSAQAGQGGKAVGGGVKSPGTVLAAVFRWGDEQFLTDTLRSSGFVDVRVSRISRPAKIPEAELAGNVETLATNPGTLAYAEKMGLSVDSPESRAALANAILEALGRRMREKDPSLDEEAVALVAIARKAT